MDYDEKSLKIAAKITAATLSESGKLDLKSAEDTVKFFKNTYKEIDRIREWEGFSKKAYKAAGKITAAAFEEAEDPSGKAAGEFFTAVYNGIAPITAEDFDEDVFKYTSKITAAACEEMEEPTLEKAEEAVEFFKAVYLGIIAPEIHGKYVIKNGEAGPSFCLVAGNGQVIGVSEVYSSDYALIKGIQSVRRNAPTAAFEDQTTEDYPTAKNPKYELYRDKAGEFRFRLKAGNGEIILASEGYTTKAACEKGIASVRKNSQSTTEEDA